MTTIQNNPVNNQHSSVARAAVTGAAIGAAMRGGAELLSQKVIFKNADSFVKGIDANAVEAKKVLFAENGFMGEAVEKGLESINTAAQKAKDFISGGKFDMQCVAKQAGKGALRLGALCAGVALVGAAIKSAADARKQQS